jgi:2-dehydro-3-deoxyglucarate aldolase/4-hydroxy-2-oxoheptanedioate aldolase
MNMPDISRFRRSETTIGTWLSIGSPVVAELAGVSGFDWLLFDLEHGCTTESALIGNLQAIRDSSAAAIVRVGAPHVDLILRVLDWGAQGVMAPHIESADDAERCVQAIHYPPRGHRGFSRSARAYGYGLHAPAEDSAPQPPLFIAQIESLAGVRAVDAIAAVDGVDMLFVGPSDLGFDLRARKQPGNPSYQECLRTVVQSARVHDKTTGILLRSLDELPGLLEVGINHFMIGSDLAALRNHFQQLVLRGREFCPGPMQNGDHANHQPAGAAKSS